MSKQDRQGVRKASDIEQKYGLGQFMYKQNQSNKEVSRGLSNLGDSLSTYREENDKAVDSIHSDISALQKSLNELTSFVNTSFEKYWQTIYPVGAIYISVSATNPSTLFGGTWEQIKDRFLLAAGSSYKAGATGGEANHTLTVNEMPAHNHQYHITYGTAANATTVNGKIQAAGDNNAWIWNQDGSITYAGGGAAHNNMPPYLAVYIWKRTA